ncbi:hypothetical protein [Streptomyces pseudogriseolus]|uniref:hypothetical protein n=1 Tax=Streptomyces pseudogriseolus TaxID=36817 RepID=UPI003FA2C4D6
MNTERPDHDDEPRLTPGDAPGTGAVERAAGGAAEAGETTAAADASGAEAGGTTEHRPEETEPGAGASEAEAGGTTGQRPATASAEPTASANGTGAASGPEKPGRTARQPASSDASAPSRPAKPEGSGSQDGDDGAPRVAGSAPGAGELAKDAPGADEHERTRAEAWAAGTDEPAKRTSASGESSTRPDASTAGADDPAKGTPAADESALTRAKPPAARADEPAKGTPAAEEPAPPQAGASAAGAGEPASSGASASGAAGTAAAGDASPEPPAAPAAAPATARAGDDEPASATGGAGGEPAADHAYAATDPVVGAGHDRDRGPGGPVRRRTPALVVSVAAAVLLVGGGGAYLAAGAGGDSGGGGTTPGANGDATPPPLALDGYSESGPNGIAPGEPNPYGVTYRADGALPEGPDAAPVFHARGQVTEQQVVALAEALGVEGAPVAEGGSWRIGGQDGSGPTLRVEQQAPGTWSFSRNTPGGDNCKGATCKAPTGGSGVNAVSEAAAKKAAAPVLKAVGQDDAKLDASQVLDGSRVVNADPVVGGLPTYGWTTGVVVGAGGEVIGGSGRLAQPVKGDEYPVMDAREALDAMNGAPGAGDRVEIGGCATPVPLDGEQQREEPCAPAAKEPAGDTVSVDEAVFGLAAHSVGGKPALVPSWLFEVRPAGSDNPFTVTHPAVEPRVLAEPSGPGDEQTSAPATREVEVQGYRAEGDELTVTFEGGVCADYKATASESGGEVTVRVTETPWPDKVCIMIAKQYEQTLRLDAPLGDRQVVTADGEPVPLHKGGARLPAPGGAR